ncbi:helix-turn-helix domain-containing protein [uncultured Robinsoniella sp.]|uniref:helix-turn-helix domain-containing protein n=1 Tax=uncultured Robinsoniella sp. TaxID=904190 RepID=UPI00290AF150|nr:helix-turn-helix transcriptional regulator [Clostridiales bacterium]
MEDIVDRIKKVRKSRGQNQGEFANDLNLKRNSITQIETRRRNPSERTLSDICRICHVNKDWLMYGTGGDDNMFIPEDVQQYYEIGMLAGEQNEFKKFCLNMMMDLPDKYWDYIYEQFKKFENKKGD